MSSNKNVFKLREPHFEKICISRTNLMLKMGIENDELNRLLKNTKNKKR